MDSYYKKSCNKEITMPAAAIAIQTFGDFLGFNSHLHILASDGCFDKNGTFYSFPNDINAYGLEPLFRHKVLKMLKTKGLITETDKTIELISPWHYSGVLSTVVPYVGSVRGESGNWLSYRDNQELTTKLTGKTSFLLKKWRTKKWA